MVKASNMYPNLNDQKCFKLNMFNEIKNYFMLKFVKEN